MLLVEDGEAVLCVGQTSHAWLSGQLARAWGNDAFAAPEPFEEVCLGVEQHDAGMAEWDLAPTLDPATGRPTSFLDMPLDTHLRLWRAAPGRVLTQSPYSALLVSMHGAALYRRRDARDPAIAGYLAEQEALQAELLAGLGEDAERAARNQRLLWALDYLSLALLLGWMPGSVAAPTQRGQEDVELRVRPAGERRAVLAPWPFGGERLGVRCQGRRLKRRFASEAELRAALASAPWETLRFELRAG